MYINQIRVNDALFVDNQQISEEINTYFATIGIDLAKDISEGTIAPFFYCVEK